jgi:hypothetical protein
MGFRDKLIKNTPKVALELIKSLIVGTYKSGKTRLWKEVTELHYQNPAEETLLLAWEKGYETWELENVLPICEEGDEVAQWEFFRGVVVKGLVEEAKTGRKIKLIGWDTVDRAVDACTAWVIQDANRRYGKKFSSLQDITESTHENGWTLLYDELKRQVDALDNAKYGQMFLAWTKEKETTLYNGLKYNSLELMLNSTAKKVFESQASLICCLFNEVKVLDREGNELDENLKNKRGKELASNFHETRVVMKFRPDEYVSIAGGRFTNLPNEPVKYSAENFLKVFEEAVEGQLKKTTKTVEELKEEQGESADRQAKQYAEKVEREEKAQDIIDKISSEVNRLSSDANTKELIIKNVVPKFKEIFKTTADYKNISDVDKLNEALRYIENLGK